MYTALMKAVLIFYKEIIMGLWKISKCSGKHFELDAKQLSLRLQAIVKQENTEIMQLAIQSMLDELTEQRAG